MCICPPLNYKCVMHTLPNIDSLLHPYNRPYLVVMSSSLRLVQIYWAGFKFLDVCKLLCIWYLYSLFQGSRQCVIFPLGATLFHHVFWTKWPRCMGRPWLAVAVVIAYPFGPLTAVTGPPNGLRTQLLPVRYKNNLWGLMGQRSCDFLRSTRR